MVLSDIIGNIAEFVVSIKIPFEYVDLVEIIGSEEMNSGIINVTVKLTKALGPRERGRLLMDLEDELCKENKCVRVWNEPLGDKNSLRSLRGIKL